jgi:hypothetical protein
MSWAALVHELPMAGRLSQRGAGERENARDALGGLPREVEAGGHHANGDGDGKVREHREDRHQH